ncbi:hypothetical protein BBBOND_0313920 [Babesia bigemina]|uniref:C3H1-type domain-containing protein n=1 Tax=Babesia bigemina TaxID=5866 RepID=A0A061DEL5_BABBI|nr:hypothetical protein BBBOND_0313920 [Babesia bigemina]CDR97490.1 hypothetical protein BBBOND_0313920 [Babesia bigemina]|eukprot:XP_012769676.1 hypothetical protein BBBOND_0313920 [Babesia bigemina]
MAFLCGVLSNIKEHLGQHKETITDAINTLNTNKHAGKKGFSVAIGSVVEGVGRYNERVKRSNDEIKKPIKNLQKQIDKNIVNAVKSILPNENAVTNDALMQAVELIKSKLLECKQFATEFNEALNTGKKEEIRKAIDDLNPRLQECVRNALKAVSHESQRLNELSNKESEDFEVTNRIITETLQSLHTQMNKHINREVKYLVEQFKRLAKDIWKQLNAIDTKLEEYVEELKKWIDASDKIVDTTIYEAEGIVQKGIGKNQQNSIKRVGEQLERRRKDLETNINGVKRKLESLAQQVTEQADSLEVNVRIGLQALRDDISKMLNDVRSSSAVNGVVKGLVGKQFQSLTESKNELTAVIGRITENSASLGSLYIKAFKQKFYDFAEALEKANLQKFQNALSPKSRKLESYVGILQRISSMLNVQPSTAGSIMELVEELNSGMRAITEHYDEVTSGTPSTVKNLKEAVDKAAGAINALGEKLKTEFHPAKEEIAKIRDDPSLTTAVAKYNALIELKTTVYGQTGGVENPDEGSLAKLIEELTKAVDGSGGVGGLKKAVETFDFAAKKQITDGASAAINEVLGKFEMDTVSDPQQINVKSMMNLFSLANESLKSTVNEIKTHATDINVDYVKSSLHTLSTELPKYLSELLDALSASGNAIKQNLQKLKRDIGKTERGTPAKDTLQHIHRQLSELRSKDLKSTITFVHGLDAFATRACQETIEKLENNVRQEVEAATVKLTTLIQKRFVCSTKSLLEKFTGKVNGELNGLSAKIHNDLNTGLNGFMLRLETHFLTGEQVIQGIDKISETHSPKQKSPLSQGAEKFNTAVKAFFGSLEKQKDFTSDYKIITPAKEALRKVLAMLAERGHFDHEFLTNLDPLETKVSEFKPSTYGEGKNPFILVAVRSGFTTIVTEFQKAYVSRYSGQIYDESHASKYVKVFATILYTLHDSLNSLNKGCMAGGGWNSRQWCKNDKRGENSLGTFLVRCGFQVATDEVSKDGELKHPSDKLSGKTIHDKLLETDYIDTEIAKHLKTCKSNKTKKPSQFNLFDLLECILYHTDKYNEVCHIPTASSTKVPSSVYDALVWFSGLPYSGVYSTLLRDSITDVLTDKDKHKAQVLDGLEFTAVDEGSLSIPAYPSDITYERVDKALAHICSMSYDIVTAIAGHGDAQTIYGSEFCNNSFKFKYPKTGDDCLQMIVDLLRRVLQCLRFLQQKCRLGAKYHGWSECLYGKSVKASNSPCEKHSTDKAECQPKCKVNCQPNCQPTSPLMSYLYDSLTGHLPHDLSSIGCKSTCNTCPKSSPGMPCLTPLGFRGFSGSTKTGADLCRIIDIFLNFDGLSCLFALDPKPPSTLSEHFSFVLTLAAGINATTTKRKSDVKTLRESFEESIDKQSIKLYENASSFTSALRDAYNSNKNHNANPHPDATNADLYTLCTDKSCVYPNRNVYCGPYLYSLSSDAYSCLAIKHSGLYLSWALYLPWTFYQYLKSLLDAFCAISCQYWGCRSCLIGDTCKPGKHGVDYNCKCNALVRCRGVLGAFYGYGFTFGDSMKLLEQHHRRYCHDFTKQLQNVLTSKCFGNLLTKCDDFLWQIRLPFFYLVLPLWSLSLFYLICVMVGRLDVLHIRSHLRIPSSHKITAQSLLAAAQVGRLAKISYLQP